MRWFLIAALSIAGTWAAIVLVLAIAGRSTSRELATLLPNLVGLFRGLVGDPRVSRRSKALLWLAALWVLSPIDLVPEFIPIAGPLDDVIVAALVLRHVVRAAGADVVAGHWRGDPATLDRILKITRLS